MAATERYDQCDTTCTTDCGHCKGQGKPEVDTTTRSVNRVFAKGDRVTLHDPKWWLHGRVGTVIAVTRGGHVRVKIDDPKDDHLIVHGAPLFFLPEA